MGPTILATCCQILRYLVLPFNIDIANKPLFIQFLARFVLMMFNAYGWIYLAWTIQRKNNSSASSASMSYISFWFLLISSVQFHIPFYSSRMLPNTFALVVVLYMYRHWMEGNIYRSATSLVFVTSIFRCDILLLLFTVGLTWIGMKQLSIINAFKIGTITGIVSLLLTVPLDSILWQRLVWPEGEVFYFNTILGKSKEWGTMPWHWYFSSALPKSMLLTLLLTPFAFIRISNVLSILQFWTTRRDKTKDKVNNNNNKTNISLVALLDFQWSQYILPPVAFICIYSCLGHKEMRFIFPALPALNLAAAVGMSRLSNFAFSIPSKGKQMSCMSLRRVMFAGGIFCILGTFMGSLVFVTVSRLNYPGGVALQELADHITKTQQHQNDPSVPVHVHVHIDVAAAMSGVSLFGQKSAQLQTSSSSSSSNVQWTFSKGGYEEEHDIDSEVGNGKDVYTKFTHMISEHDDVVVRPELFHVIGTIQGKPRLNIRSGTISTEDTIYILERKEWRYQQTTIT